MECDISPLVAEGESIFDLIHGMISDNRQLQCNLKVPFLHLILNKYKDEVKVVILTEKDFSLIICLRGLLYMNYTVNRPQSSITYIIILYFACS